MKSLNCQTLLKQINYIINHKAEKFITSPNIFLPIVFLRDIH